MKKANKHRDINPKHGVAEYGYLLCRRVALAEKKSNSEKNFLIFLSTLPIFNVVYYLCGIKFET